MNFQTFTYQPDGAVAYIILDRVAERNAISSQFVAELTALLEQLQSDDALRVVVLKSACPDFCSGMDFNEVSSAGGAEVMRNASARYFDLLKAITVFPKMVVALVEGRVTAGGTGLVAACDIVIAGSKATFSLSEALFGLIPANILPFIARRTGFQKAYHMSLTTHTVSAGKAYETGLADEHGEQPENLLRRQLPRLLRVSPLAVKRLKEYAAGLYPLDEGVKQQAMVQLEQMSTDPVINSNIRDFVQEGISPWEK